MRKREVPSCFNLGTPNFGEGTSKSATFLFGGAVLVWGKGGGHDGCIDEKGFDVAIVDETPPSLFLSQRHPASQSGEIESGNVLTYLILRCDCYITPNR